MSKGNLGIIAKYKDHLFFYSLLCHKDLVMTMMIEWCLVKVLCGRMLLIKVKLDMVGLVVSCQI